MMTKDDIQKIYEFLSEVEPLKHNLRFTTNPFVIRKDTVASHTWRAMLLALFTEDLEDASVNSNRVMELLLIHDLVELSQQGTAALGFRNEQAKIQNDTEETLERFSYLPAKLYAKILSLWDEFKQQKTQEAEIAKLLERLESNVTAIESVEAVKNPEHRVRTEAYVASKKGISEGIDRLIECQLELIAKTATK